MNELNTSLLSTFAIEDLLEGYKATPDFLIDQSCSGFPQCDLYKSDQTQVIEVSLAGYLPADILIVAEGDRIIISSRSETERMHRRINRKKFSREFVCFDGKLDLSNAKATFSNGLLSILIPQRERHPRSPFRWSFNLFKKS